MSRTIANNAPDNDSQWVARELQRLKSQIRELLSGRRILNAAEIDEGGISIVNGGSVKVVDTDAHTVAQLGALPASYNRLDGTEQPGLAFWREDGTLAVFLGDLNATLPPYRQAFQVLDRGGRIVVADDTNTGGLANPHVTAYPLQDTNVTTWPATTNSTWTTIADAFHEVQNPKLQWSIELQADPNVTGQFRLQLGGTQIGTTQTLVGGTTGNFAIWQPLAVAMPAGVTVGSIAYLELDAQRTAGTTGSVRAICRWMTGQQT